MQLYSFNCSYLSVVGLASLIIIIFLNVYFNFNILPNFFNCRSMGAMGLNLIKGVHG